MSASQKKLILLRKSPLYHVKNIQGVNTLEPYQEQILEDVAYYERTVIAASHDVGKTFLMSKIVLWFTSVFKGAKVITTAPTYKQVRMLLWSEIRAGWAKSRYPLGGVMNLTEWKIADDWFAVGFTSRNEKTEGEGQGGASGFQGFHAPYILVIFDEAVGIPPSTWKQVEGLLTSAFVRFVAIANPTTKGCEFYKCFSDPGYHKIFLNCFHSPNLKANHVTNKTELIAELGKLRHLTLDQLQDKLRSYATPNMHLITLQWVLRMCLRHGVDHPLVVSKCFGEFPEEDERTLITLASIEQAQSIEQKVTDYDRVSIGVDVARFGTDKSVITLVRGNHTISHKTLFKRDTSEVAGVVIQMLHGIKSQDIHIVVDGTGIGSGVIDKLVEARREKFLPRGTEIREVHFGSAPDINVPESQTSLREQLKKDYVNLKARIFVMLGNDLKSGAISLPPSASFDEDVYQDELPTIHYKFDSKGRWMIESKDEYKSRTGRDSPDYADSLALANYGRYDDGIGKFTEDMIKKKKSTIVGALGGDQW